jgi:hypothetical protein
MEFHAGQFELYAAKINVYAAQVEPYTVLLQFCPHTPLPPFKLNQLITCYTYRTLLTMAVISIYINIEKYFNHVYQTTSLLVVFHQLAKQW